MSHVEDIDMPIHDIAACELTAAELGGQLVKQSTYKWWGSHVGDYPLPKGFTKEDLGKCEYAIKVPGTTWEIGLAKAKGDKHYTMLFDFYGSSGRPLEQFLGGKEGNKFKQLYKINKAALEAKKRGWMATRHTNKQTGVMHLQITAP